MGSEKYKLKWSKYESNILNAFHGLLESETLSDVTLFCEGQTFKAHRLVLAACSTHFENLFSHPPVNTLVNNQIFVILDGTRADDLQILLHFMYRGEAYLHHDRINSVLRTAEVLQVKGLSEGPRSIEVNQNVPNHGGPSTSGGRSWSPNHSNPSDSPPPRKKKATDESPTRSGRLMSPRRSISPSYPAYPPRDFASMYPTAFPRIPGFPRPEPGSFSPSRPASESKSPAHIVGRSSSTGGNGYPSKFSPKEERERDVDFDVDRSSPRPASNKTDRLTPSDHYSDRGGGRNSPANMKTTLFPSDSTTDSAPGPSGLRGGNFKNDRRPSSTQDPNEAESASNDPRPKFPDFRGSREDLARITNSSPSERTTDLRLSDEDARNAANSLETFRQRLAQAQAHAHAERERFLPGLQSGIPVTMTPGLTASDYMRLAMPVRDPDNGEACSGSGTKLRCPFCERTYGYETNLRAHIRQRHQGIRVSCPYCPRTFTRNNTVRRHVAREHRHIGGGRIPTKFGSTRVMPDPLTHAPQLPPMPTPEALSKAQP